MLEMTNLRVKCGKTPIIVPTIIRRLLNLFVVNQGGQMVNVKTFVLLVAPEANPRKLGSLLHNPDVQKAPLKRVRL